MIADQELIVNELNKNTLVTLFGFNIKKYSSSNILML